MIKKYIVLSLLIVGLYANFEVILSKGSVNSDKSSHITNESSTLFSVQSGSELPFDLRATLSNSKAKYNKENIDINRAIIDNIYYFDYKAKPYIISGAGYEQFSQKVEGSSNSAFLNWGFGIKYKTLNNINFIAEAKHFIPLSQSANRYGFYVGISWVFQKNSQKKLLKTSTQTLPKNKKIKKVKPLIKADDNQYKNKTKEKKAKSLSDVKIYIDFNLISSNNKKLQELSSKIPKDTFVIIQTYTSDKKNKKQNFIYSIKKAREIKKILTDYYKISEDRVKYIGFADSFKENNYNLVIKLFKDKSKFEEYFNNTVLKIKGSL